MKKMSGRFCEKKVRPKNTFDEKSFRWKSNGQTWILIGCPRNKWNMQTDRCRVGTRAHKILFRSEGTCPTGQKVVRK